MIRQVIDQHKGNACILVVFGTTGWSDSILRWIVDVSRVRRARKAACAAISPLIARSRLRLGVIPDATWSNPYVVGFMVMLITIAAKTEIGKIEGQPLCLVQAGAWQDITGRRSGLIGEEVLLLNAARNRDFEIGCQNAMTLGSHRQFNFDAWSRHGMARTQSRSTR